MRRPRMLTVMAAAAGMLATGVAPAGAALAGDGAVPNLPSHVFAPYFEAYTSDNPAALSLASGAKYLTLAFLQTPSKGSCTIDWNGDPATPVSPSIYGSDIAKIRARGGDVVPSFGGYSADHDGTEIADSCTNVDQIAAAYEKVVTTYKVTRLDLDTEDNSLTNLPGIDRRNQAITKVEAWAAAHQRTVQFVYTVPTNVSGLDRTGVHVLKNAVANRAQISVVNIMTFDYYTGGHHNMAADTKTAAGNVYNTLRQLYPGESGSQVWHKIGVTEMVGIDDYGKPETFTTADGPIVESWATSKQIGELSFWALERDNGGCPGTAGSDSCSGVVQTAWQFSHDFEPFTHG